MAARIRCCGGCGDELNNRPAWVHIPLEGILQLMAVEPSGRGRNGIGAAAAEPEIPHAPPAAADGFH
jgi:hypothetical protein